MESMIDYNSACTQLEAQKLAWITRARVRPGPDQPDRQRCPRDSNSLRAWDSRPCGARWRSVRHDWEHLYITDI